MDDEIEVNVTEVSGGGGSIAFGEGHEVETGDFIRWAGDARMMHHIAEAIEAGEEPIALVPLWSIQYRRAA